ncbi:MAG: heme ABC exporter ATP-binding protein CcmA [Chloroflexi bacterium]|nr:MAG: heme ABC exporter ATP-binding protein CcmA [Chloroflexota bacterium]
MIKLEGLIKRYGMNLVLRGIDLQVNAGEFVTLVGSNGAGKSTLMRVVATLLQPTSGKVEIGGWSLPRQAGRVRRHIGLVSHYSLLYGDMTAAENLAFFARLYRLDHAEERVMAALRKVGLYARQRDAVSTFSRGMVQRLTIARATLHEPDILLLDEPYTGLDQDASCLLDDLLGEQHENGRSILMITHDLTHGLSVSDRIAILNQGKIVYDMASRSLSPADFLDLYNKLTRSKKKVAR